eukprot:2255882-Pyramimonas_sp.AAC.1
MASQIWSGSTYVEVGFDAQSHGDNEPRLQSLIASAVSRMGGEALGIFTGRVDHLIMAGVGNCVDWIA